MLTVGSPASRPERDVRAPFARPAVACLHGCVSAVLPARPDGRWMLGHAATMARDPLRFLEQTFTSMGDLVELPMPRQPVLLLDDPSGVDHVLRSAHRTYSKRTAQFDSLALVTGNGLLTVDEGDGEWLASRRVQQPAYHSSRLDQVVAGTARRRHVGHRLVAPLRCRRRRAGHERGQPRGGEPDPARVCAR